MEIGAYIFDVFYQVMDLISFAELITGDFGQDEGQAFVVYLPDKLSSVCLLGLFKEGGMLGLEGVNFLLKAFKFINDCVGGGSSGNKIFFGGFCKCANFK